MRRPLAVCCFAYVVSQLAAAYLPPAAFVPLAAVFVCLGLAAWAAKKRGFWLLVPLFCLAGAAAHGLGYGLQVQPALDLAGRQVDALVEVVQAEPGFGDGMVRARLKLLQTQAEPLSPGERVQVRVSAFPDCEPGQRFYVRLALETLPRDEYYYSSLADGVYLQAECLQTPEPAGESFALRYKLLRLQRRLSANVRRFLPRQEGAVLAAMASGDKSRLPDLQKENYRAAGISHLLVVSGLHLSLLCGAFVMGSPLQGRFRRLRAVGAMGLVLFMMALTGFTPSVLRAGIAALIFYAGAAALLPADSLTSLGVAAALISLQGPYAVCDIGLQLSFTAACGVALSAQLAGPWQAKAKESGRLPDVLKSGAAQALFPPVLAALFTLPVQLANGLSVSGVSVLANLLALPFVGPAVVCGLLCGVCGFVPWLGFAARTFGLLGGLLAKLLNAIAAFCAALPAAQLPIHRQYGLVCFAACLALVLCAWRLGRKRWLAAALPALLAAAAVWGNVLSAGTVEIALVGSDANPCVVATQDGRALVIFKGGEPNAQSVQEYLRQKGVGQIDQLIDLRQDPAHAPPAANQTLTVQELVQNGSRTVPFCDIMATALRLKSANLVVLDIRGYKVAVTAGTLSTGTPLRVDLLAAGSAAPGNVQAQTVLSAKAYAWHQGGNYDFYYAPQGGRVWIRPGRSAVLKGGSGAT